MPKRCASKRALVVVAALLPVSIGVGSCGHAAPRRGTDREPTAGRHADGNLLLRLRDHGSTNTPAWILAVGTDGSGVLTHDRRDDVNGDRTFKAGHLTSAPLKPCSPGWTWLTCLGAVLQSPLPRSRWALARCPLARLRAWITGEGRSASSAETAVLRSGSLRCLPGSLPGRSPEPTSGGALANERAPLRIRGPVLTQGHD